MVALCLRDPLFVDELQQHHGEGVVLTGNPCSQILFGRYSSFWKRMIIRFRRAVLFLAAIHPDRVILIDEMLFGRFQILIKSDLLAESIRVAVQNTDGDIHLPIRDFQEIGDRINGDAQHLILGKAESAGGNQRKGNRQIPLLFRRQKRIDIAAAQ